MVRRAPEASVSGFATDLRFALRELRGGLSGFYIFLGCIALGVAAISGVSAVSISIGSGIASQGQAILGGDVSLSLVQRPATQEQKTYLSGQATVAELITMRAMARRTDGADQTLVELKAVDRNYPTYGSFKVGRRVLTGADITAGQIVADPILFERLGLTVGDPLNIGSAAFTLAGMIEEEPDRVGDGVGFGPKVILSLEGMQKTGLIQPGSLLRYHYKLKLEDASPDGLKGFISETKSQFPDAGWRIRSRDNAAPALSRNVERFAQFLTLVGLVSLIVGGVGVANAIRAFMETKRPVVATLKSLGASSRFIFRLYLTQILILAAVGILLGLILGAAIPILARYFLADLLPVSTALPVYASALWPGAVFGLLTALIFAIWPLALAQGTRPTDLFRASTWSGGNQWPSPIYIVALIIAVSALIAMAILLSGNRFVAIVFISATAVSFVMLRLVAIAIQWLARMAPAVRWPELRMAIANIYRPGSLTPSVTLSLGLGLSLLVALAAIESNLRYQIAGNLPQQAPDFFFVDIQNGEIDEFRGKLDALAPEGKTIAVPMLRGRIIELKGIAAENYKAEAGGEWVLRGDRGITYAERIPENSTLASGEWWPKDYDGPPKISFSAEEAGELDLSIGDKISVNVLGRIIEAEIANLRNVEWETLGINFVMVFSPNTFAGAPHSYLATLMTEDKSEVNDGTILREIANAYPAVTSVRIRDALEIVNDLIGKLATAIRAAAVVALVTSVLVLAGALAAGNRERVHDAVVMKTLGATRIRLLATYMLEYAILGLSTALFAIIAGNLAGWYVISQIMEFTYRWDPLVTSATITVALVVTIGFGLIGTWRVLGQKAAPVLREL